jgi:hypothetical protein
MPARIHRIAFSPIEVAESSALRRRPKLPGRNRPAVFHEAFEDRVLFYDAFRHADGERALLVGPPPLNLVGALEAARFEALPSRKRLSPRRHESLSVAIWEMKVPGGTNALRLELGGEVHDIALRDNLAEKFAGRRILTNLNRDNELEWIEEWARFHARHHGADAVVMFDNGSRRYAPEDIAECLAGVPGMKDIAINSWPQKYGPVDPAVRINPYWPRFLQIASLSVALRRFAPAAAGLMNCDIDELLAPGQGPVFEQLSSSRFGLIRFKGRWVPPVAESGAPAKPTHRHYPFADPRRGRVSPGKWCLDPKRDWIANDLGVHPYMHWIEGRPFAARFYDRRRFFWHFEGLNTGWKDARAKGEGLDPGRLETDSLLASVWD